MIRHLIKLLVLLIACTTISFNILAGDIPEALMEGTQKALFIGEITEIQKEYCTVIPLTIMMGTIEEDMLQVQRFTDYYGTDEEPQKGDYIVAVLMDEQQIDPSWLFKVTSNDYETLKLVSQKYNMVERYENYINEGAYFEAQRKLDEANGLALQLIQEVQGSGESNNDAQVEIRIETEKSVKDYKGMLISIGAITSVIGLVMWFKRRYQ